MGSKIESRFPLVRMPEKIDLTLFLIREELKSRRFFNALQKMGLDDCYYQPHLDEVILANLGLDDDADETFDFYYNLMEKHSEKIEPDKDSITKEAIKVYAALCERFRLGSEV